MEKKRSLYILLTDTGTWLSRLIKWYTGEPYNHASLAFDLHLADVYSFGRKYENNPFVGGFVKENMSSPLFLDARRETTCALYEIEVSGNAYEQIDQCVQSMERERHRFKYNALGLLGIVLRKKIRRSNAYFCSQFVTEMFRAGGIDLVGKCPEFTTPGDLRRGAGIKLMYEGLLSGYPPLHKRLERSAFTRPPYSNHGLGRVRLVGAAEFGSSGQ